MNNGDSKNTETGVERRTVSGPEELFLAADRQAERKMMGSFSEYVRALIRQDLASAQKEDAQLNLLHAS